MTSSRTAARGTGGAVASGHHAATEAGLEVLREGGNAFDAAVCIGFCLNVLEPFLVGTGGEAPILVRTPDGRVRVVAGQGPAPAALTLEEARRRCGDRLPGEGLLSAVVPGALGTWLFLAEELGTLPLERLLEPAIELAEGFPVYTLLEGHLQRFAPRLLERYPTTAAVYCPGGRPPRLGERLANPALAAFYRRLARAGSPRRASELFYGGELGAVLLDAVGEGCLLRMEDLEAWSPRFEEPVARSYRGTVVHKCGPWSQGPVFLQQLALLEQFESELLARPSARGLHTLIECSKLAFADREGFYGDPDHADVPLESLLSEGYAAQRVQLIDPRRASLELRPGCPGGRQPADVPFFPAPASGDDGGAGPHAGWTGDTTHLDVADCHGNLVAATPSGGWAQSSPLLPELGFCLSTRAQMFHLVDGHPNAPAPRKRPRTTLTPSMAVLPDGRVWAFGTPGGDCQDQWTLQLFLGMADGGLGLQEACDAPLLHSAHFPNSFWPREARPGVVLVEPELASGLVDELRGLGHRIEVKPGQGRCSVVERRPDGGLAAAISRRQDHPEVGALP